MKNEGDPPPPLIVSLPAERATDMSAIKEDPAVLFFIFLPVIMLSCG